MNSNLNNQNQLQQNMTKEELKNTQVLNLGDVKNTVKKEKRASFPKKIAVFLFILGVLSIVSGLSYNSVSSMLGLTSNTEANTNTTNEAEEANETTPPSDPDTTKAVTTETNPQTTKCILSSKTQADGTDKDISYEFNFNENNQLLNYTKTLNMIPTTGNSTGPVTINNSKELYTTIATYQIPGYTVIVSPTNNGEIAGLTIGITINLTSFDKEKYTSSNITDAFAQVDFELNTTKDTIVQTLTTKGYTCQ